MPGKILKTAALFVIIYSLNGCVTIYRQQRDKRTRSYNEGLALYNKGKYAEAHDKFDTVVSIEPEYKQAYYYWKQTELIIKSKGKIIQKQADVNYYKGTTLKRARKYEDALNYFLMAKEQNPDPPEVDKRIDECREKLVPMYDQIIKFVKYQYARKQYINAYANCQRAKKIKPMGMDATSLMGDIENKLNEQSKPYRKKGKDLYDQKKYEAARNQLTIALKLNPYDKEAKELFDKCDKIITLEKDYNNAVLAYNKGDLFGSYAAFSAVSQKQKGYKDTDKYLERLMAQLKGNINNYYAMGVAYYEKENFTAAINEWNKVLILDPNHAKAKEYRDRAQAKLDMQKSLEQ